MDKNQRCDLALFLSYGNQHPLLLGHNDGMAPKAHSEKKSVFQKYKLKSEIRYM